MKLICNQKNLEIGINITSKIIGARSSLPVLGNILLATDNGRLKLSSTDLEIGINTWVGAKVIKEGSVTVPARLLTEYVSANDDEKIELTVADDVLNLKSAKYRANIKGINAKEFPLMPEVKDRKIIEIEGKKIHDAINKSVFACAIDETRLVLTGALLSLSSEAIKLAATDSYRLAEITIESEKKLASSETVIIPARTLSELARIITLEQMTKLSIYLGENQIAFSLPNTQIISRLIEGNFPDYKQIIPTGFQTKAVVFVEKLAKSIKMASFFARESANNIELALEKDKKPASPAGRLKISAVSPQVGDTVSELTLEDFSGEETKLAFNAKFVLDILNVITEEKIIIESNGKFNPVVIKPEKSKKILYIIMPLRIEE